VSWILEPIIGWGRFATLILDRLSAVRALAVEVYHIDTGSPVCSAGIG